MNDLNIPLLRKTMEYIEANPAEWNQAYWVDVTTCGTTMCFAGTAAFLAGATLFQGLDGETCTTPDGVTVGIEAYAVEQLGLGRDQKEEIFYSSTDDPQEMRELVEGVIGEKL